jgi:hypothetical protein
MAVCQTFVLRGQAALACGEISYGRPPWGGDYLRTCVQSWSSGGSGCSWSFGQLRASCGLTRRCGYGRRCGLGRTGPGPGCGAAGASVWSDGASFFRQVWIYRALSNQRGYCISGFAVTRISANPRKELSPASAGLFPARECRAQSAARLVSSAFFRLARASRVLCNRLCYSLGVGCVSSCFFGGPHG